MYRIVICDDEAVVRARLKSDLTRYAQEKGLQLELLEYASANALLQNYPAGADLLLLDIYMDGVDGMEAARSIRTFDPEVCIIFITTMYQRAIDGYAVRAFGFIKKPVSYAELCHELNCALKQIDRSRDQEQFITLRTAGAAHRLPVSCISYCEVRNHDMLICTDGDVTAYRCPMKELEEQLLPYGFLRCHASYLVNVRHIRRVEPTRIVLKDGAQVPISQRKKKEVLVALSEYIGEQI
ncbi:MAG: response regulator transcription factor [Faecalibacterium sp.]|nr:response regulator transcription factor [Faecalibacterium sp.]